MSVTFRPTAHPIFIKSFVPTSRKPWLAPFRDALALGNISYYLQGEMGFQTRVYLYNYFSFMCDADIPARWRIQCYARDGKLAAELQGKLADRASEVVDLASMKGLDAYGVLRVSIVPDGDVFLPQAHGTMFYNEYDKPGTDIAVMAHSLHVPMASHGPVYQRTASGLSVPAGFRPYLLIASGCSFHRFRHPACTWVSLSFVNADGQEMKAPVPSMRPMACQMLDLFTLEPRLTEHLGDRPFGIRLIGERFLAKPFILITDGVTALGEHL